MFWLPVVSGRLSRHSLGYPRSVHPWQPPQHLITTMPEGFGPLHASSSVAGRCPLFLWSSALVFAVLPVAVTAMIPSILIKQATNCRAVLMGVLD